MKRKIRNEKLRKRIARRLRITRSVAGSRHPIVTVFRSSKHIYAQLVDSTSGRTLGTVSSRQKAVKDAGYTGNVEAAKRVGQALAELARANQVEQAVLNRNGFLYHGRVKALADAAREAGLRL
jgi:large subunit ribosomal protein L18